MTTSQLARFNLNNVEVRVVTVTRCNNVAGVSHGQHVTPMGDIYFDFFSAAFNSFSAIMFRFQITQLESDLPDCSAACFHWSLSALRHLINILSSLLADIPKSYQFKYF